MKNKNKKNGLIKAIIIAIAIVLIGIILYKVNDYIIWDKNQNIN